MCRIEVEGAQGIVVRALGWDKLRMIQRGTSRVFGVNFGRCRDHYQWRPGEVREIPKLTKSKEIQAVRYHYIKGTV